MSEPHLDRVHANHLYEFVMCDHIEWAQDLEESVYHELKAGFREKLREVFANDPGPWSHDLDELASSYRIGSFHEIPEEVHAKLRQKWLDKLNRRRGPREQLFSALIGTFSCCYRPPHLWYSCTQHEGLIGSDAKSAQPWLIEVAAPGAKIKKRIPVYIGASWTCEVTRDGRPQSRVDQAGKSSP